MANLRKIEKTKTGLIKLKGEDYSFGKRKDFLSFADLYDATATVEILGAEKKRQKDEDSPVLQSLANYPPPQETLDLHGEISVVAERKSLGFIQRAKVGGLLTVRIITGKGLHSPGGKAILPDVVEGVVRSLKKDKLVVDYCWDRKEKIKSGALLVYL